MKHRIALSLKYMRRQKLRTVLTTICIVLSVFILNLFAVAGSTVHKTLLNELESENGIWEFDASSMLLNDNWVPDGPLPQDAEVLFKNHAAVSEYYFEDFVRFGLPDDRSGLDGICFMEIQVDDKEIMRGQELEVWAAEGNKALSPHWSNRHSAPATELQKGEVLLPEWGRVQGYAIGDSITLRITPAYAVLDDTIPQIAAFRKELAAYNADEENDYILINDGTDIGKMDTPVLNRRVMEYNLIEALEEFNYSLSDLDLQQIRRGQPAEITLKVAGFYTGTGINRAQVLNEIIVSRGDIGFITALETADSAIAPNNEEGSIHFLADREPLRYGCITKAVSFLDGLQMVIDTFNERRAGSREEIIIERGMLNEELLFAQLRYINFDSNIPVILAAIALVLLIIWGFARFIIDNAFEISVSERTRQFTTLRIMGATKKQILAVVFTEATAYTLLALTIGIAAAVGTTMLGVKVLDTALGHAEFAVYGWLLALTIVLSLLAIYISAYTSAMYAGRKLSLKDATHLQKPKKKTKRVRALQRTERGFLYRYAWKNILRTQPRLSISTIAMTLGVTLAVAMTTVLAAVAYESRHMMKDTGGYDFYVQCDGTAGYAPLMDYFEGNSDYRFGYAQTSEYIILDSENNPVVNKHGQGLINMRMIDESHYNSRLQPITGMSYQEWLRSDSALLEYGFFTTMEPDPMGEALQKRFEGATYAPAASVFGDAEPMVYSKDGTVFTLNEPLAVAGCITASAENTQMAIRQENGAEIRYPEYTLLLPVEAYYRYMPSASLIITAAAERGANYDKLVAELDDLCNQGYGISYEDSYYGYTGYVRQVLGLFAILVIIVLSIWLAGVLSMVNTLHTNVLNRRTELRMLRTVGCSIKQIKKMLVTEGMLFSAISTILGSVLGLLYAYELGGIDEVAGPAEAGILSVCIVAVMFGVNLLIANLCAKPGMKHLMKRTEES